MNDFIAMLKKIKPNVDFENEDALVDDGILESLDIITIIAEIADKYDVIIPSDEITSDNFNSAEALYELVETQFNQGLRFRFIQSLIKKGGCQA